MILQSDTIVDWAAANSKAQGEMRPAVLDSENPFYKSRFASGASVQNACREALAKNGLSVTHLPYLTEDGLVILHTKLTHSSGQWVACEWPIEPVKRDPQGWGSALTYAKRYCLAAITGVVSEAGEDDDGNAASDPDKAPNKPKAQKPPAPKPKPPKPPDDMAPTIAAAEGDIEAALAMPPDDGWALLDGVVATLKGSAVDRAAKMDLATQINRKRLDLIVVASAGLPTTEDVDRWETRLGDLITKLQKANQGEDYAQLVVTASTGLKARREQLAPVDSTNQEAQT